MTRKWGAPLAAALSGSQLRAPGSAGVSDAPWRSREEKPMLKLLRRRSSFMIGGLVALIATHSLLSSAPLVIAAQGAALALMVWARITFGLRSFHATADPTEGGLVTTLGPTESSDTPSTRLSVSSPWQVLSRTFRSLQQDSPLSSLWGPSLASSPRSISSFGVTRNTRSTQLGPRECSRVSSSYQPIGARSGDSDDFDATVGTTGSSSR